MTRRAGIRPEILNRLEQGKHSPSVATVEKSTGSSAGWKGRTHRLSQAGPRATAKGKPRARPKNQG